VRALGLSVTRAVEITSREEPGPAAQSDLRPGDLIVGVSGSPVDGIDALHRLLSRWAAGSPLTLHVVRRTQSLQVKVTPGEPR
jgi:S1-C subfamily serine protease